MLYFISKGNVISIEFYTFIYVICLINIIQLKYIRYYFDQYVKAFITRTILLESDLKSIIFFIK